MKAMITGSFDPPTLGHQDIIERSAKIFDEVVVCLCLNSEKRYMFTAEQRMEMLKACCEGLPNVTVDTCAGLVAEYAATHGVGVIVKGVRSGADFEYECVLDTVNRSIAPVDTVFLPSRPEYRHLSSTVGREMIRYGRDLSKYLPEAVVRTLKKEPENF
ncbi:MAG: pantetheine-phosphate adenylyltransferase [Eubacteriales bacterium]